MPKSEGSIDDILNFAATRRKGGAPCWTCTNLDPKRLAYIHEAKGKGVSVAAIVDYVKTKGWFPEGTVSDASFLNHFRKGHHKVAA